MCPVKKEEQTTDILIRQKCFYKENWITFKVSHDDQFYWSIQGDNLVFYPGYKVQLLPMKLLLSEVDYTLVLIQHSYDECAMC